MRKYYEYYEDYERGYRDGRKAGLNEQKQDIESKIKSLVARVKSRCHLLKPTINQQYKNITSNQLVIRLEGEYYVRTSYQKEISSSYNNLIDGSKTNLKYSDSFFKLNLDKLLSGYVDEMNELRKVLDIFKE